MMRTKDSIGIVALMSIAFLALLSGTTWGGDLEPIGPPGPTMKTLDQIPPTWSQKLPASTRFVLVLDGAGVLDKETGLVWEQSPESSIGNWFVATGICTNRTIGGRRGWRGPTIDELTSLIDPANSNPALPTGHPFSNIGGSYWSVTSAVNQQDYSVALGTDIGSAYYALRGTLLRFWCVRGGNGPNFYRP